MQIKPSDYVDMLLLINGDKPCVRLGNNSLDIYGQVTTWCKKHKYYGFVSRENLYYVTKSMLLARIARRIDDSTFRHTFILGRLLGYPSCCCRKIAAVGEDNRCF